MINPPPPAYGPGPIVRPRCPFRLIDIKKANQCIASLSTKAVNLEASDDLTTLVKPTSNSHPEVFSHALELLSSMQSAPSCNRMATSNLLKECKSIEGPSPSVQPGLDDIRSAYAAQLAVCELRGAGSQIPPYCDIGFSSGAGKPARGLDGRGNAQLRQCLKSLESRPQWWTSYSNSRQNAVVLCQAARADIEKGKSRPLEDGTSYLLPQ